MTIKGHVRSSQLVTTYGVGAMVASGDESFIVAGIDRWEEDPEHELHEPRLEKILGVQRFMRPPTSDEDESRDVPVRRFPHYHSCPSCKRLASFDFFNAAFDGNKCTFCDDGSELVPSRFVVACEDGHLDDFPFSRWVHKDHPHAEGKAKLSMVTKGEAAGLRDVVIRCSCGAMRSMDGAFGKNALKGVRRCTGARPWLAASEKEECDHTPITVQRGASNVWFASTISAISIPPWSDSAFKAINRHWTVLKAVPDAALKATIEALNIADDEYTIEDLVGAARHRKSQESGNADVEDVKTQEYEALVRGAPEKPENQFVCVTARDPGSLALEWIPTIKQVTRLREVRVLRGFSRLYPPRGSSEDDEGNTILLPGPAHGWLPAIDVIGEGVFLELTSHRLHDWESREDVRDRVARLDDQYRARGAWDPDLAVTPRFVLLHTLAHTLIDQWALESGYSAAALTERLYVSDERAGVLIYTATSDSAGSLGGVVARTDQGRLDASLTEAIRRATWCSADPLCIEAATQGADALNLAACHACALLPETSCEHHNSFLDRGLLVGIPNNPGMGFFVELE